MNINVTIDSLQASLDRRLGAGHGTQYVNKPIHMTPVWEPEHSVRIMEHIAKREDVPQDGSVKRAHVGVAGWFNFDVFSQGKHTHLLLLDTNRNQTIFWKDFGMDCAVPRFGLKQGSCIIKNGTIKA